MPELPEVHALARDLRARMVDHEILRCEIVSFAALKTVDPAPSALVGHTVRDLSHHGKVLDIAAGDLHLVVHLARAGWVRWREGPAPAPARPGRGPLAARLVLDDGSLEVTEAGTSKRLALWLVHDPQQVPAVARLGADPLAEDFTPQRLRAILAQAGRARIKGVLRDQRVLAGIGNAYSDEILHAARLSPFAPADLDEPEVDRLYRSIRDTLGRAIARTHGTDMSALKAEKKSAMRVHGRAGKPCPACGSTVRQVVYADSSLQYCPVCQTGGRILVDRAMSRLLK
ncbi:MAG: Fpg/Nei family DNA glycosylase [Cellulomonadaceae bacterium]